MFDLSFIIPVKVGDKSWEKLIEKLHQEAHCEIILVGPDFQDSVSTKYQYIYFSGNRAEKQNEGAIRARSSNLVFLHADTIIPTDFSKTILECLQKQPNIFHHFDLQFDSRGIIQLNTFFANLRSKILKMPFGDQAFFMTKKTFFRLGFFDTKAAYGEDHLLVWRAHHLRIPVRSSNKTIITSARKYKKEGWFKTTIKHLFLTYKQAAPEFYKLIKEENEAKCALAIFVKTPGYSPVKTRLAQTIGKEKAEEFFKFSLQATEEFILHSLKELKSNMAVYWAVSEQEAHQDPLWSNFLKVSQGTGSLGERLHFVQQKLMSKHSHVYMIGADSPHLSSQTLSKAISATADSDHVIGLTEDGGFYLYGGNESFNKDFWTSITYSSETTAKEFIEKIGIDRFSYLEKNFDIDTIEDLKRLATLPTENLLPKQKAVVQWAKENT
jgi:rSAM/selenodomain-associated transferase 1